MKKPPPVPTRDYAALVERVRSLRASGWIVRDEVGKVCKMPLLTATRLFGGNNPQVLLVGGIHGNEPAGVESAVSWMESGRADHWPVDWLVLPCTNPCGWSLDRRTASTNHDLNRSFNLGECCDEIQDAPGYYICEIKTRPPFAGERVVESLEAVLPIWDVAVLDGRKVATRGCVRRSPVFHATLHRRRLWPLEFHLLRHHTDHTFCSETPMSFPLKLRVQAHHAALEAALNAIIRNSAHKQNTP